MLLYFLIRYKKIKWNVRILCNIILTIIFVSTLLFKQISDLFPELLSLFRKNLFEVAKEYHQFTLNNFKLFKLTRTKMNHPKAITSLGNCFNSCSMSLSDSKSLVGLPCRDNDAECNNLLNASNRQAGLRGKIIPLIVSLFLLLTIQSSNAQ